MKDILVGWALDWLVCPRKTSWGSPVPSPGTGQPGSVGLQSLQGQQGLKHQNTEIRDRVHARPTGRGLLSGAQDGSGPQEFTGHRRLLPRFHHEGYQTEQEPRETWCGGQPRCLDTSCDPVASSHVPPSPADTPQVLEGGCSVQACLQI